MRKVTSEVVGAFLRHEKIKRGNSGSDGYRLYLHNNVIAVHVPGGIKISTCGWKTQTTKERLNAIPGVHIQQKAGTWYLNGNEWDGKETIIDTSRHSL